MNSKTFLLQIDNPFFFLFVSLWANKCFWRVNGRHFTGVVSYAMIQRCRLKSTFFVSIVQSLVYGFESVSDWHGSREEGGGSRSEVLLARRVEERRRGEGGGRGDDFDRCCCGGGGGTRVDHGSRTRYAVVDIAEEDREVAQDNRHLDD